MNYIHSKTQNSLDVKRADKLQFVYINAKHSKQQQEADTLERLQAWEEEYKWFHRPE
jgi:hypothetical protein